MRALTVVLVNRRRRPGRYFLDVACAFQARLELRCEQGFLPRCDLSGHWSNEPDRRLADLQYRNVTEFAVGRASSAGWTTDADGMVRSTWTDPLPAAEVERVAPNETIDGVEWKMEVLAEHARRGAAELTDALRLLPQRYGGWIVEQFESIARIKGSRRQETAHRLIEAMRTAQGRIQAGIDLLATDPRARRAFAAMNEALARAARQRGAQSNGKATCRSAEARSGGRSSSPSSCSTWPAWPTSGIPTARSSTCCSSRPAAARPRPISASRPGRSRIAGSAPSGMLGAGVAVLMRYTLRLLTLDQLAPRRRRGLRAGTDARRAGLAEGRQAPARRLADRDRPLGRLGAPRPTGSAARANDRTGHRRHARCRRYPADGNASAPAPLKACPWCGTAVHAARASACVPNAAGAADDGDCAAPATTAPSPATGRCRS